MMKKSSDAELQDWFSRFTTFKPNPYHPLVWIVGEPVIGKNVYIGGFTEINANLSKVKIGDFCDIASFVSINCADSHKKCIGISNYIAREDIIIGHNVFIGSHSVIKGGTIIGHHSVIAAGTVIGAVDVPPYSLVIGNPPDIKSGYYRSKIESNNDPS